jgi:hypothetical protein
VYSVPSVVKAFSSIGNAVRPAGAVTLPRRPLLAESLVLAIGPAQLPALSLIVVVEFRERGRRSTLYWYVVVCRLDSVVSTGFDNRVV